MRNFVLSFLHFLNYYGMFAGFVAFRVNYNKHKFTEWKWHHYYVEAVNIINVLLLPFAHITTVKYITSDLKNSLLAFTTLMQLFINYIAIILAVVTRRQRENLFKGITKEIFGLELTYFSKLKLSADIQSQTDMILLVKELTFVLAIYIPIHSILSQASSIDENVIMLAIFNSFMGSSLDAVTFIFFLMTWHLRQCIRKLNDQLEEMFKRLQSLHRHARGTLSQRSRTLKQLSAFEAEDLREAAGVHACLCALLLRLNSSYKWQIMAMLLNFLITNISHGYYWVVMMQSTTNGQQHQSRISLIASIAASSIGFIDINLVYWTADATAREFQQTAQIIGQFQILPLMNKTFEKQCEAFSLQIKQQRMNVNVFGMFNLNRQTSLALWSFILRHVILLLQFDYEERKKAYQPSLVLDGLSRWMEFRGN